MANPRRRGVNLENFIGRPIITPPVITSNSPSNNGTPTTVTTGTGSASAFVNGFSFTPSGGGSNSTISDATVITNATGPNSSASVTGILNDKTINQSAQSIIKQSGDVKQIFPEFKPRLGIIQNSYVKYIGTSMQSNSTISFRSIQISNDKNIMIAKT